MERRLPPTSADGGLNTALNTAVCADLLQRAEQWLRRRKSVSPSSAPFGSVRRTRGTPQPAHRGPPIPSSTPVSSVPGSWLRSVPTYGAPDLLRS